MTGSWHGRASQWLLLLSASSGASAHGGGAHGSWSWHAAPSVAIPLAVAVALYVLGCLRLWRRAGPGRGLSRAQASAYAAGIGVLIIALMSPLDAASVDLFSVHMVQHLLLIMVAPPLLVVGAPEVALLWALPSSWRRSFGRVERWAGSGLGSAQGQALGPLLVALLATGVLWFWHVPALYDLAVRNPAVHYVEHLGFLLTSLLFWATVLRLRPRDHVDNGLRILYVFGMAVQGSLLGALIALASRPLYLSHQETAETLGISALADQRLAGLIMWVPPALLYTGVVAYLFTRWLQALDRRRTRM